jgi:hypothetical protein
MIPIFYNLYTTLYPQNYMSIIHLNEIRAEEITIYSQILQPLTRLRNFYFRLLIQYWHKTTEFIPFNVFFVVKFDKINRLCMENMRFTLQIDEQIGLHILHTFCFCFEIWILKSEWNFLPPDRRLTSCFWRGFPPSS